MATRFVKPKIDKYIQLYSKYARVEEGTFSGKVKSITITNGGRGFTTVPTVTISPPNITAGGVQATGTAVLTSGVITSINVNYPTNVGYTTPAIVTIADTYYKPVGGQIGYSIKSTSIENGGNYATAPYLSISPPDTVGQTQATATCTISNNKINSVTITNAGTGYNTNPTITIFNGKIGQIILTKIGQWYELSNPPEVVISAPNIGGGIQATATAVIANTNGYELQSINITNPGTGYSITPTITIRAPLYLVYTTDVNQGGSIRYGVVVNAGSGYTSAPTVQVEIPDNPLTGQYRQATGIGILDAYGKLIGFQIQDVGKGYIARKAWTCNIFGGGGTGGSGVFYNTWGFGAEAKAYLDNNTGGGNINAYITDGYGASAQAVLEVTPLTATKHTWQLDTPIEVNENALIQVVDRVYTDIPTVDANKPIAIRMYDISSQSTVNTRNLSINNTSFYQGTIIDIGQPIRTMTNDIKLEIQPQVIDRIALSLNQGISTSAGISTAIEFVILLKITEREPAMIEYGSLNNINTRQLNM